MTEWKSLHILLDVAQWWLISLCLSSSDCIFNEDSLHRMSLMMASQNYNENLKHNNLDLHNTLY